MIEGNQAGPFSEQELSRLIAEKKVVKETYIWKPGLPKWEIAEKLPEILKLVALAPPPAAARILSRGLKNARSIAGVGLLGESSRPDF
jgi:hypothetical protein